MARCHPSSWFRSHPSASPRSWGATALLSFVLLLGFSLEAAAAPSLSNIRVSRTSGVAPLAVHFDASAATDSSVQRPFHTLHYEWNFDDPGSGSWTFSGQSKNQAIGAVAGHLFTEGGTYDVTVTITNPAGESITRSTTITVEGNDEHNWAATYCYANGSNFSGCPSGSNQVSGVSSFNSALSGRMGPNTRHLFRRGDSFSIGIYANNTAGPVHIGAFGSGARPRMNSTGSHDQVLIELRTDWRVTGLDFQGGGTPIGQPGNSSAIVNHALGYDLNMNDVFACIDFWNRSNPHPRGLAFVEISCRPRGNVRWIWHRSVDTMYLGLDIDGSGASTPPFRSMRMSHTVYQHGRSVSSNYGGLFTFRACGKSEAGCSGDVRDQYNIISDNRLTNRTGSRVIRTCLDHECNLGGSNGNQTENFIFERNYFDFDYSSSGTSQLNSALWLEGSDMTVRNNIFNLTNLPTAWNTAILEISNRGPTLGGAQANRDNHTVTHNTVAWNGAAHQTVMCRNSAGGSSHLCANNLMWVPSSTKTLATGGGWTTHGNMRDGSEYGGHPFIASASQLDGPEDFKLTPGMAAIDAGHDLAANQGDFVHVDFYRHCRAEGAGFDVGAHEVGASACQAGGGGGNGPQPPAAPILLP